MRIPLKTWEKLIQRKPRIFNPYSHHHRLHCLNIRKKRTGGKNEKKRSSGGSSGAKDHFLSSLRRRKKKQRQKSVKNFDTILEPQPTSYLPLYPPPSPPPPQPPPPPPSSVFHNLFSTKKGKTKKIQSDASPAPPPPPPPAWAKTVRAASTTKSGRGPITASKPPLPVKTNSFNGGNGNLRSGNESPLVPIPPSLPPFKMRGWKLVVHGDFVRTKSNTSSRSFPQDLNDDEEGNSSSGAAGKDGRVPTTMPMFCPSPDVNTKADTFVAKFRAGLKLEKMNSINERQGRGRFNTEPRQSPDAETVQGTGPS
ncbi:formin-like protein 8 [Juglans regia]|uniref:Formin-like protein 8 n=1 Tax=Juglans regia TaxID=51240 RepID=A0A6P9E618_JUGRE|nr:formin-like protein 8 [Juglans regia]